MCGIFGALTSIDHNKLLDAIHTIKHRGPDHTGYYSQKQLFLAHTRLSIIDLSSASNQPLWDINKKACIVFNGEIYNYKKLREDLIESGYEFASHGDAEVIVNLYLRDGEEFLHRLRGIFALAIWDAEKEELLLARDGFGVKPLYYSENKTGFFPILARAGEVLRRRPQVACGPWAL